MNRLRNFKEIKNRRDFSCFLNDLVGKSLDLDADEASDFNVLHETLINAIQKIKEQVSEIEKLEKIVGGANDSSEIRKKA